MTTLSSQRLASITAALLLLLMAFPAISAPRYVFSGYVQGRYLDNFGEEGSPAAEKPESFEVKRAYAVINAVVDEHVSALIMASLVPNSVLLEAYGEYKAAPYAARLGLSRIPFGYENPASSAKLITTERSQVSAKLIFPYVYDRGLFGYCKPDNGVNVAAGITNATPASGAIPGAGTPAESNTNKTMVARVGHSVRGGQVGVSIYRGNHPTTNLRMNRLGADLFTTFGPLTVITEVIAGNDVMVISGPEIDSIGGYVTLAYRKDGAPSEPYLRLDYFDPDRDTSGDVFKRATVGYSHYLAQNSKLTAELEVIDDEQQPALDGRATVQYQVSF